MKLTFALILSLLVLGDCGYNLCLPDGLLDIGVDVVEVAVSYDHQILAVATVDNDVIIYLFNESSFRKQLTINDTCTNIHSIFIDENDHLLVVGCDDNTVIYAPQNEYTNYNLKQTISTNGIITSVAVDQTGLHIGIGNQNGEVIIYRKNQDTGYYEQKQTIDEGDGAIGAITFGYDDAVLIVGNANSNLKFYTYDRNNSNQPYHLNTTATHPTADVVAIAADPGIQNVDGVRSARNGRHITDEVYIEHSVVAAGDSDGNLYIYFYNDEDGEYYLNQTINNCSGSTLSSVGVASYSKYVAMGCNNNVMLFQYNQNSTQYQSMQVMSEANNTVTSIKIDSHEIHIVAGSTDGNVRVYSLSEEIIIIEVEAQHHRKSYIGAGIGIGLAVSFIVSAIIYCVYTKCITKSQVGQYTNREKKPESELDDKMGDIYNQNKSVTYE